APWRSIPRVNRQAIHAGDRIVFEGGAEFAGNLVLAPPGTTSDPETAITVGSYGEGRAIIRAGRGTAIAVEDLGGVTVRDLVVVGDGLEVNEGFGVLVLHQREQAAPLDRIRIENVEARGFRYAGIYVGGAPDALPGFRRRGEGTLGFRDVRITRCTASKNMY